MGGQILEYEAKTILNTGRKEGFLSGKKEGFLSGKEETLIELVHDGFLPIEEAAKRLGISTDTIKKHIK